MLLVALPLLASSAALAQATAFTYQGRLTDSGNPADGLFDMQFKLFDTANVGTGAQQGPTVTNSTVQVTNGSFIVQLDFGACANCFNGAPRFLEVGIRPTGSANPYTILAPRQPVTSTPYAMRSNVAAVADNATQLGGISSGGFIQNSTAAQPGTNFNISGNGTVGGTLSAGAVGIGTSAPLGKLQVITTNDTNPTQVTAWDSRHVVIGGPGSSGGIGISYDQTNQVGYIQALSPSAAWRNLFLQRGGGSVLIGPIVSGAQTGRLQVQDSFTGGRFTVTEAFGSGVWAESLGPAGAGVTGRGSGIGFGVNGGSTDGTGVYGNSLNGTGVFGSSTNGTGLYASSGGPGLNNPAIRADNSNPSGIAVWATSNSVDATFVVSNGGVGDLIRGFSTISGEPIFSVQNNGTTTTRILQITGGSDLAEQFEVVEGARPGMVVAIDPEKTGRLAIARGAYNRRVAGILSGAGNLSAGMVLPDASGAKKSMPVALSGRVWVHCDATRHPIKPGDLLTTSPTAGHAMKVANYARAQGAIIGKAMTGLARGRGLVLVLVTLQ
jgi:hypothetical protein